MYIYRSQSIYLPLSLSLSLSLSSINTTQPSTDITHVSSNNTDATTGAAPTEAPH